MRGEPKPPSAAILAFLDVVCEVKLEPLRCNMIRNLYDGGETSPYTLSSAPFCAANKLR